MVETEAYCFVGKRERNMKEKNDKLEALSVLKQSKRRWQITINNTENISCVQDVLNELYCVASVKYACGCVEFAPTTQHRHIHIYVDFVNCVKGSTICKEFKGAHIEVCGGSQEQNIQYCQKDNNESFCEIGEKRVQKQYSEDIASKILEIFLNESLSPIEVAINYKDTADYIVKHFNSLQSIYNALGHKKTNGKIRG